MPIFTETIYYNELYKQYTHNGMLITNIEDFLGNTMKSNKLIKIIKVPLVAEEFIKPMKVDSISTIDNVDIMNAIALDSIIDNSSDDYHSHSSNATSHSNNSSDSSNYSSYDDSSSYSND